MKDFLNRFMASNKSLSSETKEDFSKIFYETTSLIYTSLGVNAFRPERSVNAALVDALMTGVATSLKSGSKPNTAGLTKARSLLLADPDFIDAITTGTSQKPKVDLRINQAIQRVAEHL